LCLIIVYNLAIIGRQIDKRLESPPLKTFGDLT